MAGMIDRRGFIEGISAALAALGLKIVPADSPLVENPCENDGFEDWDDDHDFADVGGPWVPPEPEPVEYRRLYEVTEPYVVEARTDTHPVFVPESWSPVGQLVGRTTFEVNGVTLPDGQCIEYEVAADGTRHVWVVEEVRA